MNLFSRSKDFISKHKFISVVVAVILLAVFYWAYGVIFAKKSTTTYASSAATKGTITTSVSGSGQVSASNTLSLQFKGSGTLIYLPVQNGQTVSKGQLIAQLDTSDTQKSIRNAQSSLESAQLSLQKIQGDSTLSTPKNKQDAIDTLNQDYQSAFNTISNVFVDLPATMTDLQNAVYGNNFSNYQTNMDYYTYTAQTYDQTITQFRDKLSKSYQLASDEYTKNFNNYKASSRSSDNATINSLLNETYSTSKDVAQALKDINNLIQFYKDTLAKYNIKENSIADTQLSTVNSDNTKINSDLTNISNIQNTIKNDNDAVSNAGLDLQSQQLSVTNAQNSLQDAKDALANYYIYAPFDGTLGKITTHVGDNIGSGTSIATIVTSQKICTIPLNEVDSAKVQPGQKVTLTFDALPDLSVAGQVATVDPVGTVSSGVVTYNVQINFDTQDQRVKSGMSVSAQIITNVKQDVIIVPNSAVKTQSGQKYVQVLINGTPTSKQVTVGLSNDTNTEIISGINEGDQVVTQTIKSGSTTTTTNTSSRTTNGFGGIGGGSVLRVGGGGGFGR